MDAARSRGVRIPEEWWIVGYDDTNMASREPFDLTTVRQGITDMARTAAELLLARIAAPDRPAERVPWTRDSSFADRQLGMLLAQL